MTVWIVHDFDSTVVSVHGTEESAKYMLRGRESEWYIRQWGVRNDDYPRPLTADERPIQDFYPMPGTYRDTDGHVKPLPST